MIQAQATNVGNDRTGMVRNPIYKRFMELGPAEFKEGSDPIVAEEWVQYLETIFEFMQLTNVDRMRYATFMFRDDARVWWKRVEPVVNLTTLNWNGFKDVFFGKYFAGSLTIDEYVRKFERGWYFVPMIANDPVEELKHFMEGLNASIHRDVKLSGASTYRAAAKRTSYQGRDQQGPSHKRPYQAPAQRRPQQQQHQILNQELPQGKNQLAANAPKPTNIPIFQKCGKPHSGQCMMGTNHYFNCKKPGHLTKDCPQVKGRVFAMTHDQVDPDSAIVTVSDESFSGFRVSLTSGEELSSDRVVRNYRIQMQGHELYADFISLDMVDFDVIFGMDWLSQHEATIDCKQRIVSLKVQNGEPFMFYAASRRSLPWVISAASLTGDQGMQRSKLEEVEVVKDFLEVFLEDVAELPPVREVEFGIELLLGTKPISKAPYRLAPTKMKELKDQIKSCWIRGSSDRVYRHGVHQCCLLRKRMGR
ncbi:uncharacterized protein [Henckelia pumila]|uniref:uncharacterized protein n=1 Tax=Henckelia pumila TaxID=405737 RepID=UPI003C6DCF1B